MPKNKVVCTELLYLALFGHEFYIIGIFGNFLSKFVIFRKITLYFATDSDPDRTEFWDWTFLNLHVKSNKSTSRNFFLAKFHFLKFQKWPKINFCTGKKFKTAKNVISRKKFLIYLISRIFLGPGSF